MCNTYKRYYLVEYNGQFDEVGNHVCDNDGVQLYFETIHEAKKFAKSRFIPADIMDMETERLVK